MISARRSRQLLDAFAGRRILVVGDLMLDRYVAGTVSRISPEAPVPVVHVESERAAAGGAANVAMNIRALGGQPIAAGVVGCDADGRELTALLAHGGVDTAGVVSDRAAGTIVKTRIMAERQQVVRVDHERPPERARGAVARLAARLPALVQKADGVVIEDYGKGVITQAVVDAALAAARARRAPVGLDPKENHALAFSHLTLATPNYVEACSAAGLAPTPLGGDLARHATLRRAGEALLARWRCELLMITLGAHGMYLARPGHAPRVIPTRAREVFDVCGAGDTVIATTMLGLAAGANPYEAAALANYAAGVVVGKIGTATCTREELLAYMRQGIED